METKTVLVTVKTYPTPSKKHTETVCCAGIDVNQTQWIRLYPIPFRDLDSFQQFKKYTIIEVQCHKAIDDHRIESYKVNSDSIKIVCHLDTKNGWLERKNMVLPAVSPSLCEIQKKVAENKSLGMFKPTQVDFAWEKATSRDEEKRKSRYAQLTFFNKRKEPVEQIPYNFYYKFKCNEHLTCPGHKLLIIDWELGQAFRDWRRNYKPESLLLEKIRKRWLTDMCNPIKDTYFYVGNMQRFRDTFMVLGVFWPPK